MKKTLIVLALMCAHTLLSPAWACAQVTATPESTAGSAVYIAGNPDLYPVEYYDPDAKCYRGILPELYAEISESTGLEFAYIRAGAQNSQQRLAKNGQAELISAHVRGEIDALSDEYSLLRFARDGEEVEVCIGFTRIAAPQTVSAILEQIERTPQGRLLGLSVSEAAKHQASKPSLLLYLAIGALACATIALLALLLRGRKKTRVRQQRQMIDPLTGMGNEEYFRQSFEALVSPAAYSLYYVAHIAIDPQRIEKYAGTSQMENIQRYAADALSSFVKSGDFSARIADCAFAFGFQSLTQDQAAQRIQEMLDALNADSGQMFTAYRTSFHAGVFHLDSANISCETALSNARQGYNYALQKKIPLAFGDDRILNRNAFVARLQSKLLDAIQGDQFRMYMQFVVDARTGEVCGAEVLSRWQNPSEGLLSPAHYIESLMTAGLIDRLDFYIFEQACRQLERWKDEGARPFWLSCNFTRMTVSSGDFLKEFEEVVRRYSFDHKKLIIELTEDSLADNKALAYQNILACKNAGFQIALDDLGSGYSSFSDLCDYPVDVIKIDRHIVAKSVTDRGNALLRGISKLAHDLGIKVLCEGVESERENANALGAECDYIQGYFYSRVLPQEEADGFLSRFRA